ncbi:hypothetical protein J3T65_02225 [Staphylococcus simiae]|uniref:hypothetical protein n=1 Tax=Staphylococcus simiae TaxID=308354 RepID=UPI001A97A1CA|nr:hypothetical protein [Staphylococcus simiae]MBO1197995.1 hypothetical protein [Staphylococcus simiae]MBO1200472.1 hypothetical protein [Staphylococcus simiae]MBO1202745.1 hypothetical protein [Staphylococcus simiae]MBO1209986.1 hypothetical protein [Staphylococcus simiae]MBO1228889.1 hypothetical protein [Staphylococcus simiae]
MSNDKNHTMTTKISFWGNLIAVVSFVLLFMSIFINYIHPMSFIKTLTFIFRYLIILGFIIMAIPDVIDKNTKKIILDIVIIIAFIFLLL